MGGLEGGRLGSVKKIVAAPHDMRQDMNVSTTQIENGWVVRIEMQEPPSAKDPLGGRVLARTKFCSTRAEIIEFIDDAMEQFDGEEADG